MQDDSTPSGSTPKLKVLIVENEDGVREMLFQYLMCLYSDIVGAVETAENGAVGLEKIASFVPDIILSDLQMPVMDGLAMGRTIREQGNATPIVYLSTVVEDSVFHQQILTITPYYLMKSAITAELRPKIMEAAASRRP